MVVSQKPPHSFQQQFFKTEETSVQGHRDFHILMIYSNYAINISVIMGSVMVASTKTLQFISVTVKSNFVIQNYLQTLLFKSQCNLLQRLL